MANFVPTQVMVNVRVNDNRAQQFREAGILEHRRSVEREQELIQNYAQQAEAMGRDAWRGNRTDAAGFSRSDSGTPIFTWSSKGKQYVTLSQLRGDLAKHGFILVDINIVRKPGDQNGMCSIRFWFQKEGTGRDEFIIRPELEPLVTKVFNVTYEHLHGFRNPNLSMTFNPSHKVDMPAKLMLRVRDNWDVNCI